MNEEFPTSLLQRFQQTLQKVDGLSRLSKCWFFKLRERKRERERENGGHF